MVITAPQKRVIAPDRYGITLPRIVLTSEDAGLLVAHWYDPVPWIWRLKDLLETGERKSDFAGNLCKVMDCPPILITPIIHDGIETGEYHCFFGDFAAYMAVVKQKNLEAYIVNTLDEIEAMDDGYFTTLSADKGNIKSAFEERITYMRNCQQNEIRTLNDLVSKYPPKKG